MIIKYTKRQSPLHHLNPLSKLLAAAVYSFAIFLIDNLAFQACALAAIVAADYAIGSRKLRAFLFSKWVLWLAGSILVMQLLFTPDGSALASIRLPWFRIAVTDLGVLKGLLMMLRFLNVIVAGGVLLPRQIP